MNKVFKQSCCSQKTLSIYEKPWRTLRFLCALCVKYLYMNQEYANKNNTL